MPEPLTTIKECTSTINDLEKKLRLLLGCEVLILFSSIPKALEIEWERLKLFLKLNVENPDTKTTVDTYSNAQGAKLVRLKTPEMLANEGFQPTIKLPDFHHLAGLYHKIMSRLKLIDSSGNFSPDTLILQGFLRLKGGKTNDPQAYRNLALLFNSNNIAALLLETKPGDLETTVIPRNNEIDPTSLDACPLILLKLNPGGKPESLLEARFVTLKDGNGKTYKLFFPPVDSIGIVPPDNPEYLKELNLIDEEDIAFIEKLRKQRYELLEQS